LLFELLCLRPLGVLTPPLSTLEVFFQELDGNESIETWITGEIQSPHAGAKAALDLVTTDVTDVTARHVWRKPSGTFMTYSRVAAPRAESSSLAR